MMYLLMAVGGYYIYLMRGIAVHIPGPYIGGYHIYTASAIMMVCYYSFYRACTDDPGIIKDKK